MIYFFSGTGNSRFAASYLSKALVESKRFIPDTNPIEEMAEGESIGFVFPVYSWGVPPLVLDFIDRLPESFWMEVKVRQIPVWIVMTCGDEVAKAPEMISSRIKSRGVEVESVWSVIMPNNYVLLPGFDVDSKEVERRKLKEAPGRLEEIVRGLRQHRHTIDVVRGSMPSLRSLVYPLFKRWGISTEKWRSTDACVGCGICARKCPLNNIAMDKDRIPMWGDNCCSCVACYHSCPRHAVAYGNATAKKGQYYLPEES